MYIIYAHCPVTKQKRNIYILVLLYNYMTKSYTNKIVHKQQQVYNNMLCYGDRYMITSTQQRSVNTFLAVVIPIIYPLPVAMIINKLFLKKSITIRY